MKYTEAQYDKVVEDYQETGNITLTAKNVGMTTNTVSGILRKRGVKITNPRDLYSQADYDNAVEDYKKTKSIRQTARNLCMSDKTVRRALSLKGIIVTSPQPKRFTKQEEANKLYAQGLSCPQIAKMFDTSAFTIWKYITPETKEKAKTARLNSTQAVNDKINALYSEGMTLAQIGEILGISAVTVWHHASSDLLAKRENRRGRPKQDKIEEPAGEYDAIPKLPDVDVTKYEAFVLFQCGETVDYAAEVLHVDVKDVRQQYRVFRAYGYKPEKC